MHRHLLQDGVEFFQLQTLGGVLLVLGGDIARSAGLTTGLVLGALEDHLNAIAFFCHDDD